MSKSSNKYNIQVAVAIDSPYSSLRQTAFHADTDSAQGTTSEGNTETGTNHNLLHTVKEVTDIQLPSISKDSYETTDINDDAGVRKYQGGLVDGGEFSFTTESYIGSPTELFTDTGSVVSTHSSKTHYLQTYFSDFPFGYIDVNGNFMEDVGEGDSNSGWTMDDGGTNANSGVRGSFGSATPTVSKHVLIKPENDTNAPTTLDTLRNPFRKLGKLYTYHHSILGTPTYDPSGSANFSLRIGHSSAFLSQIPVENSGSQFASFVQNYDGVFRILASTDSNYVSGGSNTAHIDLFRYYTWEELCSEDRTVFFKINDDSTQRMLFEARITGVEVEAPIDGVIKKTITAKVTGGIS